MTTNLPRLAVVILAIVASACVVGAADTAAKREVILESGQRRSVTVQTGTVISVGEDSVTIRVGDRERKLKGRSIRVMTADDPKLSREQTVYLSEGDTVEIGTLSGLTVVIRVEAETPPPDDGDSPDSPPGENQPQPPKTIEEEFESLRECREAARREESKPRTAEERKTSLSARIGRMYADDVEQIELLADKEHEEFTRTDVEFLRSMGVGLGDREIVKDFFRRKGQQDDGSDVADVLHLNDEKKRAAFDRLPDNERNALLAVAWNMKHDDNGKVHYAPGLRWNAWFFDKPQLRDWLQKRADWRRVSEHLESFVEQQDRWPGATLEFAFQPTPPLATHYHEMLEQQGIETPESKRKLVILLFRSGVQSEDEVVRAMLGYRGPTAPVQWLLDEKADWLLTSDD